MAQVRKEVKVGNQEEDGQRLQINGRQGVDKGECLSIGSEG